MSLRVHNLFTPETDLEQANEKLRAITKIVFPRAALTSTVQIRRILGLPDQPDMAIETRLELIIDSTIQDK